MSPDAGRRPRPAKGLDECFCSSCGSVVKKAAEICPKCGVRQRPAPTTPPPSQPQPQVVAQNLAPLPPPTPAKAAISATGCCTASTLGVLLVSGGMLESLTGVGIVIGVPTLIVGAVILILSFANTTWEGQCPYCRGRLKVPAQSAPFPCGSCRRKLVLDCSAQQFQAVH